MNNNINSNVMFNAHLNVECLGKHNTKMQNVARNFEKATSRYPDDKLYLDRFGFYENKSNLQIDVPFTKEGIKIFLKSSEDEITKASVKLFRILKYVVNKSSHFSSNTEYLSWKKAKIIDRTKDDKLLKNLDYEEIEIYP